MLFLLFECVNYGLVQKCGFFLNLTADRIGIPLSLQGSQSNPAHKKKFSCHSRPDPPAGSIVCPGGMGTALRDTRSFLFEISQKILCG